MNSVAQGEITPGEAEMIAGVVDTFVRAFEATKKDGSRPNLLQILTATNYDMDNSDGEVYDEEYDDETGDYEETEDRASKQAGREDQRLRSGRKQPPCSVGASTNTGVSAADLLQVQPSATINSTHGRSCG